LDNAVTNASSCRLRETATENKTVELSTDSRREWSLSLHS